jgi:hypothetical protein
LPAGFGTIFLSAISPNIHPRFRVQMVVKYAPACE